MRIPEARPPAAPLFVVPGIATSVRFPWKGEGQGGGPARREAPQRLQHRPRRPNRGRLAALPKRHHDPAEGGKLGRTCLGLFHQRQQRRGDPVRRATLLSILASTLRAHFWASVLRSNVSDAEG